MGTTLVLSQNAREIADCPKCRANWETCHTYDCCVCGDRFRTCMSSSMRWRKGVMGRWIFMTRLLALREMTSWVWRCGHAIDVGVIVRWTGWDDEPDAGHQGRFGRGFVQRVGELFSSNVFM